MFATTIKTDITINAPIALVWKILMDFEAYSQWNPFITSIEGNAERGANLRANILGMTMQPTVLEAVPQQTFRWKGKLGFSGVFDGEHQFVLKDNGDGTTTFLHNEYFYGVLIPIFSLFMKRKTIDGFEAMNQALRARAEAFVVA